MSLGEIKCHEINSQYQLKNTSYFHDNCLTVKGYRCSTIHTNNTLHKIHSSTFLYDCHEWNKDNLTPQITRMWPDALRDGRPAEYRWHPLRKIPSFHSLYHATKFGWHTCCSSAIQQHCQYRRTQDLDVKWILHRTKFCQGARALRKCIYSVATQETAKHHAKFGCPLVSERHHCSNEAKMRNPLKFAGVPQTR